MNKLQQLHEVGQSTWLNTLNRPFIQSGELRSWMIEGVQGFTANAANFDTILTSTEEYDKAIWEQVRAGIPAPRIHSELIIRDVQVAADTMHDVYQESDGLEGYVSLELNPRLMHDAVNTVAEVTHLETVINRPNAMVEVPATPAGIQAVKHLTKDGVSINITHVFSVDAYAQAAKAYLEGLEVFLDTHSVWRFVPVSVVSFSLSPIDEAVDPLLKEKGKKELLGKTAVSLAKLLYNICHHTFSGPQWEKLDRQSACVLRPKWTRTTPHDPAYPKLYYLEKLIGPDTVTTFSTKTLEAFLERGVVVPTLTRQVEQAQEHLRQLSLLGIDMDVIAQELQQEYLQASEKQFQSITRHISRKREALELEREHVTA
jgi:transaldolase